MRPRRLASRPLAVLSLLLLAAACSNNTPVATAVKLKASSKPTVKATTTATPGEDTQATGPADVPSPSPTDATVTATATPTATPDLTPPVAVSAPPITFPFTQVGATYTYSLAVTTSFPVPIAGSISLAVQALTATGATLKAGFTLTGLAASGLPNQAPQATNVPKTAANPYSLGVLFPKAGADVTDTVTKAVSAPITVPGLTGVTPATLYTIVELPAGDTNQADRSDIQLWVGTDGTMLQQIITSTKPPSLVDASKLPVKLTGNIVTTLKLTARGTAAVDAGATNTAGATKAATATGASPAKGATGA